MPDYVAHATKDRVDEGAAGILRAAQSHHKKRYMVRRLGKVRLSRVSFPHSKIDKNGNQEDEN